MPTCILVLKCSDIEKNKKIKYTDIFSKCFLKMKAETVFNKKSKKMQVYGRSKLPAVR